jgi:glycosyltransferase involved in cell wall biosynthesis
MIKSDIDFFKYQNNFEKCSNVKSVLIKKTEKSHKPIVTVVIPTYKCKINVLKEAIDSVLNQKDFSEFELIIVDNNPEINCTTNCLINEYNNDKIVYFKNSQNIGMFGNWNRGVELSSSNWVIFLHDDDIMSPHFLATCYPFLNDQSIGILKPFNIKFSDSKVLNFEEPRNLKIERLTLIDFIWGCEIGAPTNIIYNRSVLIELGGFNLDFFPSADYVLAINFVKKHFVCRVPFVLGGYRVGENESLNPNTMKLFYLKRFLITSFVMKIYRFPDFFIKFIHSALMPSVIRKTNNFYNTDIPFNYCVELGINRTSEFVQRSTERILYLFRYALAFRRKLLSWIKF